MNSRTLFALLLCAGCGSGGTNNSASDYRSYAATNAQSLCEAIFRCCTPAQAAAKGSDVNDCASKFQASTQPTLAPVYAAFAAGTVLFDATAGAACVDAGRAALANCDGAYSSRSLIAMCNNTVVGTQPLGAACDPAVPVTCAPGGLCGSSSRTCQKVALAGEDCSTVSCTLGLSCMSDKRCRAPLADGQACTSGLECSSNTCSSGYCGPSATVRLSICG